jgi:phosphoribosylcarboxyaminoimidazole (NCAIR) mutase
MPKPPPDRSLQAIVPVPAARRIYLPGMLVHKRSMPVLGVGRQQAFAGRRFIAQHRADAQRHSRHATFAIGHAGAANAAVCVALLACMT